MPLTCPSEPITSSPGSTPLDRVDRAPQLTFAVSETRATNALMSVPGCCCTTNLIPGADAPGIDACDTDPPNTRPETVATTNDLLPPTAPTSASG